jgi:hypothetical protein
LKTLARTTIVNGEYLFAIATAIETAMYPTSITTSPKFQNTLVEV